MSNKFCPAGKCECKCFSIGACYIGDGTAMHRIDIKYYEVCPWPSRQQPTASEACDNTRQQCIHLPTCRLAIAKRPINCTPEKCNIYLSRLDIYLAGAAEQSKRDKAKIMKLQEKWNIENKSNVFECNQIFNDCIYELTALEAAKIKEK